MDRFVLLNLIYENQKNCGLKPEMLLGKNVKRYARVKKEKKNQDE